MSNIGKPAYQGRPEPELVAKRFMLIVVTLLILGFLRAVVKNGWLDNTIAFILS